MFNTLKKNPDESVQKEEPFLAAASVPGASSGKLNMIGPKMLRRIASNLPEGEKLVRASRLHWVVLLPGLMLMGVAFALLCLAVVVPTLEFDLDWPPAGSGVESKDDQVTYHINIPVWAISLLLALMVSTLAVMKANVGKWLWTVWVITDFQVTDMYLPPYPLEDDTKPLSAYEISGVSVTRHLEERMLRSGVITLSTKIEGPSWVIQPAPNAKEMAADIIAVRKHVEELNKAEPIVVVLPQEEPKPPPTPRPRRLHERRPR